MPKDRSRKNQQAVKMVQQSPSESYASVSDEMVQNIKTKKKELVKKLQSNAVDIPDPTMFGQYYTEDDYEDLAQALQNILELNGVDNTLFTKLNQQQQQMIDMDLKYSMQIALLQQQVTEEQQQIISKLNESLNQSGSTLLDLQNRYAQLVDDLLSQLTVMKTTEKNLKSSITEMDRLNRLRQQLIEEQKLHSNDVSVFIQFQTISLQMLQLFTGIYIYQGSNLKALTPQPDIDLSGDYFIYRNQIDNVNFQGKIEVRGEQVQMKTVQIPKNVVQDKEVLNMFKGVTDLDQIQYLHLVFKQMCEQYTQFQIQQME
ncbi:Conserved_hypothetical protein [Hexamita inflata]|uniref:Uncharacterized protein n=1 Tax=Hexamita inflata TaxID=28002 RepID=A0AA86RI75_9EUKA|nr:Conserved hypothetical protein [Hexamita inflata]